MHTSWFEDNNGRIGQAGNACLPKCIKEKEVGSYRDKNLDFTICFNYSCSFNYLNDVNYFNNLNNVNNGAGERFC